MTSANSARTFAIVELLFAGLIWGFGFIATKWALPGIGPIWMTSIRFLMAIAFLDFGFRALGRPLKYSRRAFVQTLWPGVFLFALLTFQTWGLEFTSATRSGFITVLYVLFVPFLERLFLKRRVPALVWVWIGCAILGTALIVGALEWTAQGLVPTADFLGAFNRGDGLTLLCALAAAAHLMSVNHQMSHTSASGASLGVGPDSAPDPVLFHIYQSAWTVLFAAAFGSIVEGLDWVDRLTSGAWTLHVWLGMLHLGLVSSAIAFLIQVRAQRFVAPTTVGLMVLLESPWAMLFSVALLGETLTGLQGIGATLILVAAVGEVVMPKNNL